MSQVQRIRWLPARRAEPEDLGVPFRMSDFSPEPRTMLLVLQPTPFCNIDCDYCYLPNRNRKARMEVAIAATAARRLRDDGLLDKVLSVVWHAGEPTTLTPQYYEEAIEAIADVIPSSVVVNHSMQTNATLIDEAWCEFFARHAVKVGVSIDGPPALHDAHRRTRGGNGTHTAAMRGIELLRNAAIPFHTIAVVTKTTLENFEAFVEFFERLGATEVGCNFDEAEGVHALSSIAGHEDAHTGFFQGLIQRCGRPGNELVVRELIRARHLILKGLPTRVWRGRCWPENPQVVPFSIISVAHDGSFSTFSPELIGQHHPAYGDFVFGNVRDAGYLDAANNPAFRRVWSAVTQGVVACERECAYFAYCGGGAPANKLYELGSFAGTETLYCRAMVKRPFNVALECAETWLQHRTGST